MVMIGKFDILATFSFVKARVSGSSVSQAKQYGYMIAVMGARGKGAMYKPSSVNLAASPMKKVQKKTSVFSAADFDSKVAGHMGDYFSKKFLPAIEKFVKKGYTYDQVKAMLKFPPVRGAKLSGEEFSKRVSAVK